MTISKRSAWLTSATLIALALGLFIGWQWHDFTSRFRSTPVEIPANVALDPLASVVVDPQLLGSLHGAEKEQGRALLPRLSAAPDYSRERAQLALTWLHAAQLTKILPQTLLENDRIYSTESTQPIAKLHLTDAWGNPYCILRHDSALVILSTGDKGHPDCSAFLSTARKAAVPNAPATLRAGPDGSLVTVQSWN